MTTKLVVLTLLALALSALTLGSAYPGMTIYADGLEVVDGIVGDILDLTHGGTIGGDVAIEGSLDVEYDAGVQGNLGVAGDMAVAGDLDVHGGLTADTDAEVLGALSVSGALVADSLRAYPATSGDISGEYVSVTIDTNATGIGACLYLGTDGHYDDAVSTSLAAVKCRVVALAAGTGAEKPVLVRGYIKFTGWSFDVGADVYVSGSAGVISKTAPTVAGQYVKRVGYAVAADTIYFDASGSVVGL